MTPPFPLMYVVWEDACGVTSDWEDLKEVDLETHQICSIGWMIHSDLDKVVLAANFTPLNDGPMVTGCMAIPRRAILECRQLNLGEDPA